MLIEELLNEVLNTKFDFNIIADNKKTLKAEATIGTEKYTFHAYTTRSGGLWHIEFLKVQGGYELTKSGNEFKVFAAARQFCDMLIKKNPKQISFTGDVYEGRTNLYRKFALYLAAQYNLELNIIEDGSVHTYTLSRDSVNEVLNTKVDFHRSETRPDSSDFVSKQATIDGREYDFRAHYDDYDDAWELAFSLIKANNGKGTTFDYEKTNTGNEFKVFAAMRQFTEQFIKDKNPHKILFYADKAEGRVNLYAKFANQLAAKFNHYLKVRNGISTKFILSKSKIKTFGESLNSEN